MTMIVEWIGASLRDHPELALFLALATGYLLGRVRIGSFKLGPVVGCLLAGITVGQIGIVRTGCSWQNVFPFVPIFHWLQNGASILPGFWPGCASTGGADVVVRCDRIPYCICGGDSPRVRCWNGDRASCRWFAFFGG